MKKKKMSKKQEATLKRMKSTRKADYVFLRNVVKKKLEWAILEKEKGLETIRNVNKQILRLEGIIIVLRELAEATPEKDK